MKRSKWIFGICGIAAGIVAVFAGVWMISYAGNRTMDREQALGFALEDAVLEESDVTITREKLESDDGKKYYEIDFYSASYAYEYEIDAVSGAVLGVSIEALFDRPDTVQDTVNVTVDQSQPSVDLSPETGTQTALGNQTAPETLPEQDGRISMDAAKAAALEDAGFVEAEVVFSKTELDYEDGVEIYEIEFCTGRTKYEYEIDAATGAVVERDTDDCSYDNYCGYRGHHGYHHAHNCWYE